MIGMATRNIFNTYKLFDDDDIILNLLMDRGVSGLIRNQRMEFALILQIIQDRKRDEQPKDFK